MKKKIAITIDADVLDKVEHLAKEEDRSVSSQINNILKNYFKESKWFALFYYCSIISSTLSPASLHLLMKRLHASWATGLRLLIFLSVVVMLMLTSPLHKKIEQDKLALFLYFIFDFLNVSLDFNHNI